MKEQDYFNDSEVTKLLNQLIKALPGFIPLEEEVFTSDAQQRYGLAQCYANKGFRDYLIRSIKIQTSSMAVVEDLRGIWVQKGRIEILKELLKVSKQMFLEAEKIDKSIKDK